MARDAQLRRARRLLAAALDPETPDPWWRVDEAKDILDAEVDGPESLRVLDDDPRDGET